MRSRMPIRPTPTPLWLARNRSSIPARQAGAKVPNNHRHVLVSHVHPNLCLLTAGGQIATPGKFVKRDWEETSSRSENPCVASIVSREE
jgi:hypothetical protein